MTHSTRIARPFALAALAMTLVACGGGEKAEEAKDEATPPTDAEIEAACANLEKILAEKNPDKAKREAEQCPDSIKKTPAAKAKPFADCLAKAADETAFIEECMPLRK